MELKRVGGYELDGKVIWGVTKDQARIALAKHELALWFTKIAGADGELTVEKMLAAVALDPVQVAKAIRALAPAGTVRKPRAPQAEGERKVGRPRKVPEAEAGVEAAA